MSRGRVLLAPTDAVCPTIWTTLVKDYFPLLPLADERQDQETALPSGTTITLYNPISGGIVVQDCRFAWSTDVEINSWIGHTASAVLAA